MSALHATAKSVRSVGRSWKLRAVCVTVAVCACAGVQAGTVLAAGAPVIGLEQATGGVTSGMVEAKIDPSGSTTTCSVQYVTEVAFHASGWSEAQTVACPGTVGSGEGERWVFVNLGGLAIDTHYEYRVAATNSGGSTVAPEAVFVTFGLDAFSFGAFTGPTIGPGEEPLSAEALTSAAGHPYELVTSFVLNSNKGRYGVGNREAEFSTVATLKDVRVHLPVGMVGNPAATRKCSLRAAETHDCSGEDQVGKMEVRVNEKNGKYGVREDEPLFNVVPPRGVAARFSAKFNGFVNGVIDGHLRAGSDYGIDADSLDITALGKPEVVVVRMWGEPGNPVHTPERVCEGINGGYIIGCAFPGQSRPFLTMPTGCRGVMTTVGEASAYQDPGVYAQGIQHMPQTTGCEHVGFAPTIEARPADTQADSPTGMNIKLHVPQDEEPESVATSDLKNATVTFPASVAVNPSSADGLTACSETQAGFTGYAELNPTGEPGVKTAQFTPGAAQCPDAAKIGSVIVHTPLLEHPLPGALYLATPHDNPFGSLIAVYLTVDDSVSGVVIKLPGKVQLDSQTGQISTVFEQNPQLPFEDLEVQLFGAKEAVSHSRAALTTPATCGSYTATSLLEPWSHIGAEGEGGTPDASPQSEPFQVSEASGGGPCPASEAQAPNSPGFEAGTASPVGGAYSPFVLKLGREDGSQRFGALDVTLPPGMIGKVAGLEQCPQADIQAAEALSGEGGGASEQAHASCPAGSEVGVVHVGAGSGAPFYVGGRAYFAGPYKGAPFSLVVITPAVAGPFDLGVVVVRAALYIDPSTAQVTVKSDPFPTILDGIPLDIRSVGVDIDRSDFTLNPTSCDAMSVNGHEQSTTGQTAALSDRFQVGGCTTLPFHPSLTASAGGKTSRKDGASLTVHVGSSSGQANIAKVHVELPKQLPARNDTLKLACTEAVFTANPAGCPEGSKVGTATAFTPILAVPLTGPAYLVSHGGAAFPDLEIVLQAEGVTIVLDGKTNIDEKTGITSSFERVPDAPINAFELSLPEGPHSILGAPSGLCTRTVLVKKVTVRAKQHGHVKKRTVTRTVKKSVAVGLVMPTVIQGQNGAVINQKTPIQVTGCPATVKHKTKPKPKAKSKGHAKSKTKRSVKPTQKRK